MRIPLAITIAGSDSCGGAGIEADLKTMSAFRVYGAAAITVVTAQNTLGVTNSFCLDPDVVVAQIEAVMDDTGVDAAKTGMLGTSSVVLAVADAVRRRGVPNLVVDPVMVATSGARLAEDGVAEAFGRVLIPLATVVTPNISEAEALSGLDIRSTADMEEAAHRIHSLGAASVLIKGGHLEEQDRVGEATDILFDGSAVTRLTRRRVPGGKIHGTGCTLSAAIASGLAIGWSVGSAVARAKDYVTACIAGALPIGRGSALINHLPADEMTAEEEA